MKIIKKYTAIQISEKKIDNDSVVNLEYGTTGAFCEQIIKTEFDTEEEAIEYAYNNSKWRTWLIVPVIRFDNF